MRAVILPEDWYKEATIFTERLNSIQPLYFCIPYTEDSLIDLKEFVTHLHKTLAKRDVSSAMLILPNYFASGDRIDLWPNMIQTNSTFRWILSIYFSDSWLQVEEELARLDLESNENLLNETHLTCQYQPAYTKLLLLGEGRNCQTYHPGDYFKLDILPIISKMEGNWVYWGHGEGDKLRGYDQLHTSDLLNFHSGNCLNFTLWFTCSTLDRDYPENIALAWYLSGATSCILASPDKVKTDDNIQLSQAWFVVANEARRKTIADVVLEVLVENPVVFGEILSHYFLLGIPWVKGQI